ncbi:MAG: hypothetical protein HC809_14685 [Gammaproteobacteria bacterium]|nr:hypothetical protein [Gammaproteobacteria bacterium]
MAAERVQLFGVGVDAMTMHDMVGAARGAIQRGEQCSIFAVNPEKIMTAQRLPQLRAHLTASEWLIADGIGVVVAARLRGARITERVPGSDLMPALCDMAQANGYGVYLLGAREESNVAAAANLQARYPRLQIAGRHHGYVEDADEAALIEAINQTSTDIFFACSWDGPASQCRGFPPATKR